MTWHYTGDPASSSKDAVRFLIGDVMRGDPLRTDEEITFALTEASGSIYRAGALLLDSLASQFAREADKQVDDVRTALSQRARAFASRADELRDRAVTGLTGVLLAGPFLGGASHSRAITEREDTDFPQPPVQPHQFDNPGAGQTVRGRDAD